LISNSMGASMKITVNVDGSKLMSLSKIKPFQGDLKKLSDENFQKLRDQIVKTGFNFAPHVWNSPGTVYILDGHQRVHVLKQLLKAGYSLYDTCGAPLGDKIPVNVVYAKTLEEAKTMVLQAVSQYGKLDQQGFVDFTEGLELDLEGFDFPDFTVPELDNATLKGDGDGTGDNIPDVVDNPSGVQKGDLWQLGNHRLMCGDSTSKEEVDRLMCGEKASLLLTDPPYNVGYVGKTNDALTIENDSMGDSDFRNFLELAFKAADNVMEKGAAFYIWHADLEGYNFRGAVHHTRWLLKQNLIWVKNVLVMGRQDYQWKHEPCLYGWKAGAAHLWNSDRKQTTCLEFDKPSRNDIHPTMKPLSLFIYQIENSSNKNSHVLDLFLGSGTTLIACEKTNRRCFGMEIDPHYCSVIIKRWEDYTGLDAHKIS
jgi:site-specific DNA-methyltransferase (adenine-specific)